MGRALKAIYFLQLEICHIFYYTNVYSSGLIRRGTNIDTFSLVPGYFPSVF